MEFYFDIEFIKELQFKLNQSEIIKDFVKFLKQLNGAKVYIFINSTSFDSELLINNPLLKYISDSSTFSILNHSEIDLILENDNTTGFKSFFLNSSDTKYVRDNFGYFALNTEELIENKLLFDPGRQDLKKITSNSNGENYLNNWSILKKFKHPINSIVINDRYFLNNTNNIDINFLSILDNIGLRHLKKRKVDIFIITEEILNMARKDDPVPILNSKFEKVYNIIISHLNKLLGKANFNITILRADKNTQPKASKLHYRILFTNFLIINSEPSFSFFEKRNNGNISSRVNEDVSFDFVLWQRSRVSLEVKLENIKLAFNKITDSETKPQKKRILTNNKHCRLLVN